MSWPLVKLGSVCTLINGDRGKNYPSKSALLTDGVPFINAGNLLDDHLIQCKGPNFISEEHYDLLSNGKIQQGDLLFCLRGSLGKFGIVDSSITRGAIASSLVIIRSNEGLDESYLKNYLKSTVCAQEIVRFENGAAQPNLSAKDLKKFEIPLPPLAEQKRIAAILDKADAIRRKRQQAIQLADEFLRSVFLDMFGDPVTNPKGWDDQLMLKDIADIRSGVTKGKKIDIATSVTLPYMRVANVQDGYLDLGDIQNITVSPSDAEKCRLEAGDILLTEGGDPDKLGRGHIWQGEIENCIHQNHIFSVRVKSTEQVIPEFLAVVIASQRGKRYFLKVGKQTTGIATINKTVLGEFYPVIPPMHLQQEYLEIVDKVNSVKSKYLQNDCSLFESLSQKAFKGELSGAY